MKLFQFKVSLNVFPSFRSGTQYLIFIYVNNNKREEQRQVLRLNFTEIEFPKNLDWIASKSFDARMKGFIETSKIFLSFLLCSQGILICSCFAPQQSNQENLKFYLHLKVLSSTGIYFLNDLKLSMINDTLEYKLLRD